jgi:pimeloyl-ACP methyl ester carboxylesterase
MSDEDWETTLCFNIVVPPQVRRPMIFSRQIDSDDVLSETRVPMLVTHGDRDIVVLPSMAQHVLDVCPTAEACWYEVGGAPFLEDPGRFNWKLADFTRRANT